MRGRDGQRLLLMSLLAVWGLVWGYSFFVLAAYPPSGSGFARGMNRVTTFYGLQLLATLPAFAAWAVGRSWPKDSGVRYASRLPLQLASALGAVVGGLILWAVLEGG